MSLPPLNALGGILGAEFASQSAPGPVAITPLRSIVGILNTGVAGTFNPDTNTISTTSISQNTTIIADAVVEENHEDVSIVTEQPVEAGSVINDHMYKMPAKLELIYGWSMGSNQNATKDLSFLKTLYAQLLQLQVTATLCSVNTGKRVYENMVITAIIERTEKETENSLVVRVAMQEIIMVNSQILQTAPASQQAFPQQTSGMVNSGSQNLQPAPNFNPAGGP